MNRDDPPSPAPRRHLLLLPLVAAALVAVLGFGEVAPSVALVSSVPVADESGAASRPAALVTSRHVSRRRTRALAPRGAGRLVPRPLRSSTPAPPRTPSRWRIPPLRGPPNRRVAIGAPA